MGVVEDTFTFIIWDDQKCGDSCGGIGVLAPCSGRCNVCFKKKIISKIGSLKIGSKTEEFGICAALEKLGT